jgi:3'(2'), 5'-bisphosphate nucleotidase
MESIERQELTIELANIASAAGRLILARRESACRIDRKPDGSPVTTADIEAERFIRAKVSAILTDVPIIAEESFAATCKAPERFVLVDPLDGTREFVASNAASPSSERFMLRHSIRFISAGPTWPKPLPKRPT